MLLHFPRPTHARPSPPVHRAISDPPSSPQRCRHAQSRLPIPSDLVRGVTGGIRTVLESRSGPGRSADTHDIHHGEGGYRDAQMTPHPARRLLLSPTDPFTPHHPISPLSSGVSPNAPVSHLSGTDSLAFTDSLSSTDASHSPLFMSPMPPAPQNPAPQNPAPARIGPSRSVFNPDLQFDLEL